MSKYGSVRVMLTSGVVIEQNMSMPFDKMVEDFSVYNVLKFEGFVINRHFVNLFHIVEKPDVVEPSLPGETVVPFKSPETKQ